ncbi:MAG: hypothetical protein ABJB97_09065 [Acidobacteriota bacterium]
MYCQFCGNEVALELNYCNRCGAQLGSSENLPAPMAAPVRLTVPTIVLGFTIIGGLGIIFGGASELAHMQLPPVAITWIILFSLATLFGCTALLLRFWSTLVLSQRQSPVFQQTMRQAPAAVAPSQLPPRVFEPVPSVTEHTTRTFTPVYREPSDRT